MTDDLVHDSLASRVVVGSDGSPNARRAVEWAADYAQLHQLALTVVRVVPTAPLPSRTGVYRAMRHGPDFAGRVWDAARRGLDIHVEGLGATHPGLDIASALVGGETATVLVEISAASRLLVLGATGASAVSRMLLGGSVAAVIRHARGPVVIVPDAPGRHEGPVLVGLDDATSSEPVAEAAIREAETSQIGLVAVYAWEVHTTLPSSEATGLDIAEIDAVYDGLLADLTSSAEAAGVQVTRLVRHGPAADVLVDMSVDSSLLVVGRRGQGGFPGLLLGSVSRSVIARSSCPVLVIRNNPSLAEPGEFRG